MTSVTLNWFDITEVEGHFSLNDQVKDIARTEEGKAILGELLTFSPAASNLDGLMKMMGSFTVLRLANLLFAMHEKDKGLTKEDLLAINTRLNQIAKP